MNTLNLIPVVGWLIAAVICFFIAIPIYFLWNWLAPIYFYWLPSVFLHIPFTHIVGLLWLISSVKGIILPEFNVSNNVKK